jgi:ADP-heptose:LPS heptosyltransferase
MARIDFLGAPIAAELFKDLPLDNVLTITRSYPGSALHYPLLMHRLRSTGYDAAVDLSCSQSGMAAFLVGFSGARLRIGLKGKWDRWFNATVNKPSEISKYKILPNYLASLGLKCDSTARSLILTDGELEAGRGVLQSLTARQGGRAIVGVFTGGRKSWGKRWPVKNFCELITGLKLRGLAVVVFTGPDENDLVGSLRINSNAEIPIVFEPGLKRFAALVSNCDRFVTCDSGPMHLAYALGTPTVAIFNYPNFDRWAPPADFVTVAYDCAGCSPKEVLRICSELLAVHNHAA